jgi:hypothetical protein
MSDYTVIIEDSPISDRMWYKGQEATVDPKNGQIRVGGNWFAFDERWKVKRKDD